MDARTHVYGLGAILFEILTCRPPHDRRDTADLLARIISGETPRAREVARGRAAMMDGTSLSPRREWGESSQSATPIEDSGRATQADIPRALDAVCAKAMAKSRSDRYARATDLAEEVQRYLANQPVSRQVRLTVAVLFPSVAFRPTSHRR